MKALPSIFPNLEKIARDCHKSSEILGSGRVIFGSIRVIFGNLRKCSEIFGSIRVIFGCLRCHLHCVTTFCTELPLFCIVLTENCISLNQSEWRIFFMYIIKGLMISSRCPNLVKCRDTAPLTQFNSVSYP